MYLLSTQKRASSLFIILVLSLFNTTEINSQSCNYTLGGDGLSLALPAPITINGMMQDWTPYLGDADNNAYDNTSGADLDWPISDAGRDLSRFTFTENATHLFLYIERAGSTNNSVDIVFYADINNNGIMESKEPVLVINWSGATGNANMSIQNYVPGVSSLLNSISDNLDGASLMGSLSYRKSISATARGSQDGKALELKVAFTDLTQLDILGNVIHQLSFGQDFKFHISTINGSVSSIPGANSINDNIGGCLKAPLVVLPVKILSFTAANDNTNVTLNWATANEENFSHFVVERSNDGKYFSEVGIVLSGSNSGNYAYQDKNVNAANGICYYRLQCVDVSGKSTYSFIRVIKFAKNKMAELSLTVYPNPVAGQLNITLPQAWQNKEVIIEVVNTQGMSVQSNSYHHASQTEMLQTSQLTKGMYFIKARCNNELVNQQVIKN